MHTVQLLTEKAYRVKETVDILNLEPAATSTLIVPAAVSIVINKGVVYC